MCLHLTRREQTMHLLWNICCCFNYLVSSFYKGWQEFPARYKKQALAVVFLVLEAISPVLEIFGKSRWSFLLAAFLLSAFGFAMTIYTSFIERTQLRAQRQLRVVEIVFSFVQFIATFVHFTVAILGAKNSYNVSFFPLAFAIIAAVFVFKKNEFEDGLHNNQELQDITWENQELGDTPWNYYYELDDQWQDHQELQDDLWEDNPELHVDGLCYYQDLDDVLLEDYQEIQGEPWEDQILHDDSWCYQELHDIPLQDYLELPDASWVDQKLHNNQWQYQELYDDDDAWEDYQEQLQDESLEDQELHDDPWDFQELVDASLDNYQVLYDESWEDQELNEDPGDYQEPCDYLWEDQELHDDSWDYQELYDNPLENYDELYEPWEDQERHESSWYYNQEPCDDLWDYHDPRLNDDSGVIKSLAMICWNYNDSKP